MTNKSHLLIRLLPWMILLAAAGVRLLTFFDVELKGFDEHTYVTFAEILHRFGLPGLRELTAHYSSDPQLAASPLPFRIGFIALASSVCQMLGGFSVGHVAWISLVAGVLFIVFTYQFVKSVAGVRAGLLTALLISASPLAMALSRRALQDALVASVTLLVIYFFHLSWRKTHWAHPLFLALFITCGLLLKEATLFIYPSLMLAGIYYLRTQPIGSWRRVLVALCAGPLIYLVVMHFVAGGLPTFFHVFREYSAMQSKLPYTMDYGRGAWFRYFVDFLMLSPVTVLLAFASLAVPAASPGEHDLKRLSWLYMLGGTLVFGMLPVLAVRVVLYLNVFICALAVLTLLWLIARVPLQKRLIKVTAILLFATVVAIDLSQFQRIFVKAQVYDPTTMALVRANRFFNRWTPPPTTP